MLSLSFTRSPRLPRLIALTMSSNSARPAGRRPYRGKKAMTTNAAPRDAAPPPPVRVSTPPLAAPVPLDTPRFADLAAEKLLHPVLLQTITQDLKFDRMMPVQAATLHELLANRIDCLAQAKTGTGKTMAFLLPAIQTLINKNRRPASGVSLLVISPTRELAMQIAKEATALLQRLPQYKVSFAIGGTNKNTEEKDILRGCDILIATPGRLYDHLSHPGIVEAFRNLDTLVLDEADRLLDMGFMNALKNIISCLPDKAASQRQGMLFSATIAPHVEKVAHLVLAPGYKFISTIPVGEVNTHERVPQHLVVVPTFSDVAAALVGALRAEIAIAGAQTFIVARGMDFPGVTNVLQVGIPSDKESAGAEGRGTFIVAEAETFFSTWTLKEIKFEPAPADLSSKSEVRAIAEKRDNQSKTYQAWMGYYKNHCKGLKWDSEELVRQANQFARDGLGSPDVPGVAKSTLSKMGLKGIHGFTGTSHVWRKNVSALSTHYRLIIPDLRGHGASQKPDHGFQVSRLAMDLRELILLLQGTQEMGMERGWKAIGGSLGASILWCYASLFTTFPFTHTVFVDQAPLQNALPGWDAGYCNRGMNNPLAVATLQSTLATSPADAHQATIAACLAYRAYPLPSDFASPAAREAQTRDDEETHSGRKISAYTPGSSHL
ncbi:putative ATP-dependent rna helicase protein [Diplocarpon rosae]|nr:putative ATP-dependent rna helicase protein [Diplocarpon rosae]